MSGRVDVAAYMRLPTRSCSGLSNSGYDPAGMDSASATDTKNAGEYGSLVLGLMAVGAEALDELADVRRLVMAQGDGRDRDTTSS